MTVLNSPPWIKGINFSPNPAVVDSPLQYTYAEVSDDDGVASCAFDFGEEVEPVWEAGTLAPPEWDPDSTTRFICTGPEHTYALEGSHEITIQATDTLGLARTSTPAYITIVPRPYLFVRSRADGRARRPDSGADAPGSGRACVLRSRGTRRRSARPCARALASPRRSPASAGPTGRALRGSLAGA